LLHFLDSSKTGLRGPSFACVKRLVQRYGSSMQVVVDAAQMRTSHSGLAEYLDIGCMVIVSGSKFYTGAPFSGGLLVPGTIARMLDGVAALPEGFGDYWSAYDVPPRWSRWRAQLPVAPNVGVLVRWLVALWEMQAFASVPAHEQRSILHEFAHRFRAALAGRPQLALVAAPIGERQEAPRHERWDQLQTIFTFLVHMPSPGGRPLSYDEAWRMYTWLNKDISDRLPGDATAEERALAAKACHIGQPVKLGSAQGFTIGALRIAAGARLVSRIAFDPTLGATPAERLDAQVAGAVQVLDKVSLIVRHWPAIEHTNLAVPAA